MQLVCAKKKDEKTYEFHIGGEIGTEVNGTYIEADMALLNKNKLADRINFRINSEGGSVINGVRIISAIYKSQIPVHTYNDGFAMSMAGFIRLSANMEIRHAADFAVLMLHAPRFVGENGELIEPENEDDKRMLEVITGMLSKIAKNNTGKLTAEIAEILSKDTFYTAKECVNAGFLKANNIIKYNKKLQLDGTVQEKIQRIAAFYNEQELDNQNLQKMKQIAAKLKLNPEASEAAILDKIEAIEAEKSEAMADLKELQDENNKNVTAISDAEKKIKALETQVSEFETKEAEAKKQLAESEVKAAIKDGYFKVDEEAEKALTAIAVKDIEAFRTMKKSVNREVKSPDITLELQGAGDQIIKLAAEHGLKPEQMNYEYLWKNDEAKLNAIKRDNPRIFAVLEKQFNESEKSEE